MHVGGVCGLDDVDAILDFDFDSVDGDFSHKVLVQLAFRRALSHRNGVKSFTSAQHTDAVAATQDRRWQLTVGR
jgi:hypothetical protein